MDCPKCGELTTNSDAECLALTGVCVRCESRCVEAEYDWDNLEDFVEPEPDTGIQ